MLVVDLDRQTNVSMMLGHNTSDAPASMSDVFTGRPLRECVLTDVLQPGLSLVVGDPRLADVEFNLGSARRREEVLARQLDGQLDDYDYVLIDCPPNQGLLAVNAVVLAFELVVPVRMTDPNSINGLGDLLAFYDELADAGWPRPISAVLRLDVDERRDLYRTFDAALANLDVPVSPVQIPSQAAVAKAAARGRPIAHWRPGSRAGMAYLHFAEQLHAVAAAA